MDTGACSSVLRGHADAVTCLQFNEDHFISGSSDNTIRVWDRKLNRCSKVLRGHQGDILCLQADKDRIVSG